MFILWIEGITNSGARFFMPGIILAGEWNFKKKSPPASGGDILLNQI